MEKRVIELLISLYPKGVNSGLGITSLSYQE
jgi:hypothetical protein